MMEVQISLDFACCVCGHAVGVTVKWVGNKVGTDADTVAAVNVPCPDCGHVNRLSFEPGGRVREVSLYAVPRLLPEPSVN